MVVIGIIGILSSIVYASLGSARASSRDEIRRTDVKDLELAIRLYKAQNGSFPLSCNGNNVWGGTIGGSMKCGAGVDYITGLTPDFIAKLPTDDRFPTGDAGYIYVSNGIDYKLMAYNTVESKIIKNVNDEFARCPALAAPGCNSLSEIANTYAVYSVGAKNW